MNLIANYKKAKAKVDKIKQTIIDEIVEVKENALLGAKPYVDSKGVKCNYIHIIKFSDLKSSWEPNDYLLGGRVKAEMDDVVTQLQGAKDIVDSLNKIVNYKNVSNRRKWYFTKVDDAIVDKIKIILGNDYYAIPKNTKKRNISSYPSKN